MNADARNETLWRDLANTGRKPILVVRHGRTRWNRERRFLGRSDLPLDALGCAQADALGTRLASTPLSGVWSSPLARARQTAEGVLRHHPAPPTLQLDARLAELSQGVLEGEHDRVLSGRYPSLHRRWQLDPAHARIPAGETLSECRLRAAAALTSLARRSRPGPPLLVVTHQLVLASLMLTIRGEPLSHFSRYSQPNTAVNLISHGPDGWRIHLLADRDHLRDLPTA